MSGMQGKMGAESGVEERSLDLGVAGHDPESLWISMNGRVPPVAIGGAVDSGCKRGLTGLAPVVRSDHGKKPCSQAVQSFPEVFTDRRPRRRILITSWIGQDSVPHHGGQGLLLTATNRVRCC